ncbi:MAG: hypothetical protein OQK98_06325 [Gammaproteobacteria bacterium]|nr:hypothetical protein [Gammaproteobacteria bacterium]
MYTSEYEFSISGNARPRYLPKLVCVKLKYLLVIVALSLVSPASLSCQGDDYQRTMQVMQMSFQVGMEFAQTLNVELLKQRLQNLSTRIQQLPPSCQALLQQMNNGIGGGAGGTNCMGGVCCDSTGCY